MKAILIRPFLLEGNFMKELEILISNKEISEELIAKLPEEMYKVIISDSKKINLKPIENLYNINHHSELQIEYLSIIPKRFNQNTVIELVWDKKNFFEMEKNYAYIRINKTRKIKQYYSLDEFLDDYSK